MRQPTRAVGQWPNQQLPRNELGAGRHSRGWECRPVRVGAPSAVTAVCCPIGCRPFRDVADVDIADGAAARDVCTISEQRPDLHATRTEMSRLSALLALERSSSGRLPLLSQEQFLDRDCSPRSNTLWLPLRLQRLEQGGAIVRRRTGA